MQQTIYRLRQPDGTFVHRLAEQQAMDLIHSTSPSGAKLGYQYITAARNTPDAIEVKLIAFDHAGPICLDRHGQRVRVHEAHGPIAALI